MTKVLENPIIKLDENSAKMIEKAYSLYLKKQNSTKKQKKQNTKWLYE